MSPSKKSALNMELLLILHQIQTWNKFSTRCWGHQQVLRAPAGAEGTSDFENWMVIVCKWTISKDICFHKANQNCPVFFKRPLLFFYLLYRTIWKVFNLKIKRPVSIKRPALVFSQMSLLNVRYNLKKYFLNPLTSGTYNRDFRVVLKVK